MILTVQIASPPDRDVLVAEIWRGDQMVAEVWPREDAPTVIEFYDVGRNGYIILQLDELMKAIEYAKERLGF